MFIMSLASHVVLTNNLVNDHLDLLLKYGRSLSPYNWNGNA
jgi:hypothetical protein